MGSQSSYRFRRNERWLVVIAHPDDEPMFGGLCLGGAEQGSRITLICATRGELGEISDPRLATRETLGRVREAELRQSSRVLGVTEVGFLGYRDSGPPPGKRNADARCYSQADARVAVSQLVHRIRAIRPHVVITYEPDGWYGHPDHIAVSRNTSAAFHLAGEHGSYAEAGPPWQPRELLHSVVLKEQFRALRDGIAALGMDTSVFELFDFDAAEATSARVSYVLDSQDEVAKKHAALCCHRTQYGPDHPIRCLPREQIHAWLGAEQYIHVEPEEARAVAHKTLQLAPDLRGL